MLHNCGCVRFLNVPLDHDSSMATTMHTSYGRYHWLRLPFGVASAPEEFQMRLATALEGLPGLANIADDILIFGEGDTSTEAEIDHDRNLISLLNRCAQENIKLNPSKLQFKLKSVKFMGEVVTDKGLTIDPAKVEAILSMPTPHDKASVLRYIGMLNYLSPYCPNLSSCIQPLRNLTQEGVEFLWSATQQTAFDQSKRMIAEAPTLMYYDMDKPVVLQVDASEGGLGGALLQPNSEGKLQPVAYTSCSLSQSEQKYAQIEKECLAICHAFDRWDLWLYGKADITVHTDHQPLQTIFRKPLNKAPLRLQKMMMRLQIYSFVVQYQKGSSLHIADTLSRAYLPNSVKTNVTGYEVFRIDLESYKDNPRLLPSTTSNIRTETTNDPSLSALREIITNGWPGKKDALPESLHQYWNYRDELTVYNGIIYKGHQCFVPSTLRASMLEKIHVNHVGPESNIRMAREVLFWPGMRGAITDMCSACAKCAEYSSSAPKEPMRSLPIPTRPWELISQDICSYEGTDYLVSVCHFLDRIEVNQLENTLSTTIIDKTQQHFA